jgi:Tol biopolymer transport system component
VVFTRVGESQDLCTVTPEQDGPRAVPLIASDAGESLGRWSPSGDLLAYVTFDAPYETDPRRMDVHVLDVRTGADRVILEGAASVGWASDEVLIVVF